MCNITRISLSRGFVAIIDADLYPVLGRRKWYAKTDKAGNTYAVRATKRVGGKQGTEHMHRTVIKAPQHRKVDHINGLTLDNRRENLRLCSTHQNSRNRKKQRSPSSSKYKGVAWHVCHKKWRAALRVGNKVIHLGYFGDEESAASAYNHAARKYFGDFARLNECRGHDQDIMRVIRILEGQEP